MTTSFKFVLLSALYIAQGLPFGFFMQTLPVLLRERGLSLGAIGLSSLLAAPWGLKFLWAPWVDRFWWPALGKRRSWILPLQLASVTLMAALAASDVMQALWPLLTCVLLTNVLAATQDIATDGLAVELLTPGERGIGNGVQVAGYRVGMIVGGGLLLVLAEPLGFSGSFWSMAVFLLVLTLPAVLLREPPPTHATAQVDYAQLWQFFRRPGLRSWFFVLLLYKSADALGSGMLRPMLVDAGYRLGDLGFLLGTVGFAAGLVGALLGGLSVNRLGHERALVSFAVLQALTLASYAWLPSAPKVVVYALCTLEHIASGMATAALFTMMMDRCRLTSAATDYTVQGCVVLAAGGAFGALSGFVAEAIGYTAYFLVVATLGLAIAVAVQRLLRTHNR
jgi:predicted MFS family arabinose efflux permease